MAVDRFSEFTGESGATDCFLIRVNFLADQHIREGGELSFVMIGAIKFMAIMTVMIALSLAFPNIAHWLPSLFF